MIDLETFPVSIVLAHCLGNFEEKNAAIALKQKDIPMMEQTCFCAKQTNAQMPLLYLQFRNFNLRLGAQKSWNLSNSTRGKHLQLIVSSQLTYRVVRKTTVRQCHGVAIYSLAPWAPCIP